MLEQIGWETIGKLAMGGVVGAVVGWLIAWTVNEAGIDPGWATVIIGLLAGAAVALCVLS